MSYQLYRQSTVGDSLVEALDDLITEGKITEDLALKVLTEFDDVFSEMLRTKVQAKTAFKGKLDTYRYCDNVWTFIMSDTTFRTSPSGGSTTKDKDVVEVLVPKVKIVCVDAKLSAQGAA